MDIAGGEQRDAHLTRERSIPYPSRHLRRSVLGGGVLAGLYLLRAALAAFPLRETFFPLHRFSPKPLAVGVFGTVIALVGWLLAWRIQGGPRNRGGKARFSWGSASTAGWGL